MTGKGSSRRRRRQQQRRAGNTGSDKGLDRTFLIVAGIFVVVALIFAILIGLSASGGM